MDHIFVHGAREHNLKNVDVAIPRDRLVVLTGLSGSGKSSLAFDTIYAEGQRRYVESLSAYARQFLGLMEKPDVDYIDGLSPAISIDQKGVGRNPRSTVGTVTEIYDYLRLLFARIGNPHCPQCGRRITQQTVQQMVDAVQALPSGAPIMLLAPLVRDRKGEYRQLLEDVRKAGYARVRVDGAVRSLDEEIDLKQNKKHTIEVVVDRLVVSPDLGNRLADSLETASKLGGGLVLVSVLGVTKATTELHSAAAEIRPFVNRQSEDIVFSEHFACVECGIALEEIAPRTFSFNSPHGACPACTGLGTTLEIDPDLVIPNKNLSLIDGAIAPWTYAKDGYYWQLVESVARHYHIPLAVPVIELTDDQVRALLYGSGKERVTMRFERRNGGRGHEFRTTYEGVIPNLQRRYRDSESDAVREDIERYMMNRPCPTCDGARLKPTSLAVTVGGRNIHQVTQLTVHSALAFFDRLDLTEREQLIARQILKEMRARLGFLANVGLDYLTLNRTAGTLSGGEAQRIRLATQIGAGLMGVLYILDEPSIGLHQRDNRRLIETLHHLRDVGNTLLVVEHDEEMMRSADWIVDIGPGAGELGGQIVVAGTLSDVMACPQSLTGQYLSGRKQIRVPARRRIANDHPPRTDGSSERHSSIASSFVPGGKVLRVRGAREHNLKAIDVAIPLGLFVGITGVSGSGKSTLITEVLYRALAQRLYRAKVRPGAHDAIEGLEHLDKVIDIDQSPIGRTPRSNPATYTGVFTPMRELFATVPAARIRGYRAGRFSFNVKGGRCEACQGDGIIQIEMQFLPDVYVPCEVCKGKRYNRETLEVTYKEKNIAAVLDMTVDTAVEFFTNVPAIRRKLKTVQDVGLGYVKLGQPATTLSGGEAQRVKLAAELSRRATGRTLYILDEPTTGLHFADIERLLHVLQRLVDGGNTVIVIEHHLDVIKCVDWIIDLGPEGGDGGGWLIAEGTPEQVAASPDSYTGQFLRRLLVPAERRAAPAAAAS